MGLSGIRRLAAVFVPALGAVLACASLGSAGSSAAVTPQCVGGARVDFDGDGDGDVAVGDPKAGLGAVPGAGAVHVIYGTDKIGGGARSLLTSQSPAIGPRRGPVEAGAGFGATVRAAYIDDDACSDLIIGAPWKDDGPQRPDAGAVYVVFGSPKGLGGNRPGMVLTAAGWDSAQSGQLFGWSVAGAEPAGAEGFTLAVGAPHETRGGKTAAGAVYMVWFDGAVRPTEYRSFDQGGDKDTVPDTAEDGDLFGWSVRIVAAGGAADRHDVIVGTPYEDVDHEGADAGALTILHDVSGPAAKITGRQWHSRDLGIDTVRGTRLGYSLAVVERGGVSFVAVGAPGATAGGKKRAGLVKLFRADGKGLNAGRIIDAKSTDRGGAKQDDEYGSSVALGSSKLFSDGVVLAVGAPAPASGRAGFVEIVPLNAASGARRFESLVGGTAPGAAARAGWQVGFAGDLGREPVLLIGVPDHRRQVAGAVIVQPMSGASPRLLVPDGSQVPAEDSVDFGAALVG